MSANNPQENRGRSSSDPTRLAIFAACGIFIAAFSTMIVIGLAKMRVPDANAIMDTCEWLVALTATAIVGLISRGRS